MSRINKEMYNKNHKSHIFDFVSKDSNQNKSKNIKPIKIELKEEKTINNTNNVLKNFINKEKEEPEKVKIIRHQYHNESDIFFIKSLPLSMRQEIKEAAFPKKKKYISNYAPEKYIKFSNSSFDKKMHDLYNEKGDKFMENKGSIKGKPKKVKISSKGYFEYVEKYNNENYSKYIDLNKNHNINHKETERKFYNKQEKFNPNSTASDNYNREFESDIFNFKNNNYKKFMNKNKKNDRLNKSVDDLNKRNIKVKGICKWPADLNWTKNSELIFKSHIKNLARNKSMSAYDRNHIDSVKNILEGDNEKNNETRKIRRNKSDLGRSDFKRPLFDKKEYSISRARKLSNNCSVLDDEKNYKNNIGLKNMGKKYEAKEYLVAKAGNIDLYEFGKLLKSKGIHLIEVKEDNNIIKNEKKNKNDRIIHFKIRENIYNDKKNDKLKSIEKQLKKKNRQLKIRPAPKKKSHGLKSYDYHYRNIDAKNKRAEILKS